MAVINFIRNHIIGFTMLFIVYPIAWITSFELFSRDPSCLNAGCLIVSTVFGVMISVLFDQTCGRDTERGGVR